jgi:hypothetical protein
MRLPGPNDDKKSSHTWVSGEGEAQRELALELEFRPQATDVVMRN